MSDDLIQQLILRRFNEGVAEDHLLVDILPGGVLIFDSGSNPEIRQLTALDISGLSATLDLRKLLSAQNLYAVTGLTGGGPSNLDGQPTAGGVQSVGALIAVEATTGIISLYRLRNGTTATSNPDSIRPLDYDVSTNQVYWALVAVLNTGASAVAGYGATAVYEGDLQINDTFGVILTPAAKTLSYAIFDFGSAPTGSPAKIQVLNASDAVVATFTLEAGLVRGKVLPDSAAPLLSADAIYHCKISQIGSTAPGSYLRITPYFE